MSNDNGFKKTKEIEVNLIKDNTLSGDFKWSYTFYSSEDIRGKTKLIIEVPEPKIEIRRSELKSAIEKVYKNNIMYNSESLCIELFGEIE